MVGPRKSSIALPKAKLAPKKGSWSLFCGLLPIWSITASWIPAKIPHLWEICSANQWDTPKTTKLQPALVNRKAPVLHHNNALPQPTLQKFNKLGYKVLSHQPYSPDLSQTKYHFFKHLNNFLQGQCFHSSRTQKCFPRVCWNPKYRFLCYGNKQTYFLLARTCWL